MDEYVIRARIRRLVFVSSALSRAMLAGDFRSSFRGRGMDFDSVREYEVTDDAMRMDWNATARFARPFLKTYREDRGLSVYLVMDESASMDFGAGRTKRETAVLAASLLAHACALNGVLVGGLFFGGGGFEHFEPAAGERPVRVLAERLISGSRMQGVRGRGSQARGQPGSDLAGALEAAVAHLKRRSLVIVVSDFKTVGFAVPLALLARRHDAVAVLVRDTLDAKPPRVPFLLRAMDAESGVPRLVAPRSRHYAETLVAESRSARLEWLAALSAAKVPSMELDAGTDPARVLMDFFRRRRGA
ncbi:MAG: DUF58 domain-containing protein [Spirochaetota bacterium]